MLKGGALGANGYKKFGIRESRRQSVLVQPVAVAEKQVGDRLIFFEKLKPESHSIVKFEIRLARKFLGKRDLPLRRQEFVESVVSQFVERIEKVDSGARRVPLENRLLKGLHHEAGEYVSLRDRITKPIGAPELVEIRPEGNFIRVGDGVARTVRVTGCRKNRPPSTSYSSGNFGRS